MIQERLEREYSLDLVTTAPGVIYKVHKTDGTSFDLTNPSNLPDPSEIEYMEEPVVAAEIMVTSEYIGPIMQLCQERRGVYRETEYIESGRALLRYDMPLNEVIYDFFDALKSRSRGYASFDYELKEYVRSSLCKLDILVNREQVDALSFIVFEGSAYERGRKMCEMLIPYTEGQVIPALMASSDVEILEYTEEGTFRASAIGTWFAGVRPDDTDYVLLIRKNP